MTDQKMTKKKKEEVLRELANLSINRKGSSWKKLMKEANNVEDGDEALEILGKMGNREQIIYEKLAEDKKEEKRQFTWEEMVRRRCGCTIPQACVVDNLPYVDCFLCFSEGRPPKPGIGKESLEAMKLAEIERRKKLGLTKPVKIEEYPDMPDGIVKDLRDANNGLMEAERKLLRIKKHMEVIRKENAPSEKKFSIPKIFRRWQKDVAKDFANIFMEQAKHDMKKATYKNMLVRCHCDALTSNKNGVCSSCQARKTLEIAEKEVERKKGRWTK